MAEEEARLKARSHPIGISRRWALLERVGGLGTETSPAHAAQNQVGPAVRGKAGCGPPFCWGAVGCSLPAPRVVGGPRARSGSAWLRRAASVTEPPRPSGMLVVKPRQEPVFPASVAATCFTR